MWTWPRWRWGRIRPSAGWRSRRLLAHHLSLRRRRRPLQRHRAPALKGRGALVLVKALPFALTGAQKRVFEQIREDMARPSPMLRLVQGDVGTGMLASMGVHRRPFRCRRAPIGYQSLKERGREKYLKRSE